jgi:nicotinamidase/pyrazinamidase
VVGTGGVEFYDQLSFRAFDAVFDKGEYAAAYSGFEGRSADGRTLGGWLRDRGIETVDVCGIATDYCVHATALDAASQGFATTVLVDLTAAVAPDQLPEIRQLWRAAGVDVRST